MPILNWLAQNYGTIIVCTILAAIFGLLIASLIRDRRAGRSSCGGSCAGCAMSGCCHAARAQAANDGDSTGASDTTPAPKGGD